MKKYLLLLLPLQAMAQADADSNNWFRIQTNFMENPATVGENGKNIVKLDYAFNSPSDEASSIAFQTGLRNSKHSFGILANASVKDIKSIISHYYASYSYKLIDDQRGRLQIGLNAGIVRKVVDFNKITTGDMIFPRSGFLTPTGETNYTHLVSKFNTNLGLFWQKKNWYAGSSLQNVLEPNLSHFDKKAPLYRVWQNDIGYLHRINPKLKLTGMLHTETNRFYTLLRPGLMLLYKDKWYAQAEASLQQLYMFKMGRYSYNRWRWQMQFDRNGLSNVLPKNRVSFNVSRSLQKKQK